jgi:hypothetical protein
MDFYVTAVERHLLRRILRAGDRRQQLLPDAPFTPPREAVVNRLMGPVLRRTILPATAASLHVHDAAQYPPVIVSRRTALVSRQLRLNLRPLFVAEPKQARVHGWPPNPLNPSTNPLNQRMVN